MLEIKRIGLGAIHASGCAAPKQEMNTVRPSLPPSRRGHKSSVGDVPSKLGQKSKSCFVAPAVSMSTPNTKREKSSRNPYVVNVYPKENRAPHLPQASATTKLSVINAAHDGSLR